MPADLSCHAQAFQEALSGLGAASAPSPSVVSTCHDALSLAYVLLQLRCLSTRCAASLGELSSSVLEAEASATTAGGWWAVCSEAW